MARRVSFLIVAGFVAILALIASVQAQDVRVSPGLVTANNVDITADDGSLLSERLSVGDTLYIIDDPNNQKKGWVRIAKDPNDPVGIGWVESKFIRSFNQYRKVKGGSKSRPATQASGISAPSSAATTGKSLVGLVEFSYAQGDALAGKRTEQTFVNALNKAGNLNLAPSPFSPANVDIESAASLQSFARQNGLSGVFVGTLSPKLGSNRLLKAKYYDANQNSFVVEKVTKLPVSGDVDSSIRQLVQSMLGMIQ